MYIAHSRTHACTVCKYTDTHMHTNICTCTHTHARAHTHTRTHVHTHTHTYTRTHMHANTHECTHTHTHTHTHTQTWKQASTHTVCTYVGKYKVPTNTYVHACMPIHNSTLFITYIYVLHTYICMHISTYALTTCIATVLRRL